ncbi:MAG TPA: hypothetical protein VFC19_05965 [Candidatus Limnocylindrales bacterium]|nr:hypothetical protein [Candidatus Limnocylindrales bacterium]
MTSHLAASRRVVFAPVTIALGMVLLTASAAAAVHFRLSGLDGALPWCALGAAAGFATSGSV